MCSVRQNRQGKVVFSTSASSFFFSVIKNALVGLHFSQFCTPGSGLRKVKAVISHQLKCDGVNLSRFSTIQSLSYLTKPWGQTLSKLSSLFLVS